MSLRHSVKLISVLWCVTSAFDANAQSQLRPIKDFYAPVTGRIEMSTALYKAQGALPSNPAEIVALHQRLTQLADTAGSMPEPMDLLATWMGMKQIVQSQNWIAVSIVNDGESFKEAKHFMHTDLVRIGTPQGETLRRGGNNAQTQITRFDAGSSQIATIRFIDWLSRTRGLFDREWRETEADSCRVFSSTAPPNSIVTLITDKSAAFVRASANLRAGQCRILAIHLYPISPKHALEPVLVPKMSLLFSRISESGQSSVDQRWSVTCFRPESVELDVPISQEEFMETATTGTVVAIDSGAGAVPASYYAKRPISDVGSGTKEQLRERLEAASNGPDRISRSRLLLSVLGGIGMFSTALLAIRRWYRVK